MVRFKALITALALLLAAGGAWSYYIDGSLEDWGVDLSASGADRVGYLDTNVPSGPTVDYVTEDNTDVHHGWVKVGPGYSYRNCFDVEAIYLDNDEQYLYFAVVSGVPENGCTIGGYTYRPGDLAIDAGPATSGDGSAYEFGLDIDTGTLYQVEKWDKVTYPDFDEANPWAIESGSSLGSVDLVYSGNQNFHYVIEGAIPLELLGLDVGDQVTLHWTMQCGNDYLDLSGDIDYQPGGGGVRPVPEPATLLLLGTGLLGLGGLARRHTSHL